MAASSVAAKLKLEAEQSKLKQDALACDSLNDDKCGRVTIWCTTTLKPIGSISFNNVVMSLSIAGGQLFVGDVGGEISIFAHHTSCEAFKAQICARVDQSARVESTIASCFLARREKLQVQFNLSWCDVALLAAFLVVAWRREGSGLRMLDRLTC